MASSTLARPRLIPTRPSDSMAWMGPDLRWRLLPFSAAVLVVWLVSGGAAWLGFRSGLLGVQLLFGLLGGALLFPAGAALQLLLSRLRGILRVPATPADVVLQAGYFTLNAPVEEAFFRGLVQGGLGVLLTPPVAFVVATAAYGLYHRLGRWSWLDVLAAALAGIPLGLAFWLLPGPASLLGVSIAHVGATCGYLGPGPWVLRRLRLL